MQYMVSVTWAHLIMRWAHSTLERITGAIWGGEQHKLCRRMQIRCATARIMHVIAGSVGLPSADKWVGPISLPYHGRVGPGQFHGCRAGRANVNMPTDRRAGSGNCRDDMGGPGQYIMLLKHGPAGYLIHELGLISVNGIGRQAGWIARTLGVGPADVLRLASGPIHMGSYRCSPAYQWAPAVYSGVRSGLMHARLIELAYARYTADTGGPM
ncbi:hypothetical protein EV424DRAFT_1351268 [Suillus variegatus]|nr:hypothetical protein EV424DRAFT_1351268 [Suillus variegatus]